VLSVNGTLIHRSAAEAPETCKVTPFSKELFVLLILAIQLEIYDNYRFSLFRKY